MKLQAMPADGTHYSITSNGTSILVNNNTVFVGGNFTTVNGAPRNYLTAIDDNFVVPVTLMDFTAHILNDQLYVSWFTNSEANISHFDIEVSFDGKDFKKAGTVLSQAPGGYSSTPLKYTLDMPLNNILFLGFGGLFSVLLLPMFKNKSKILHRKHSLIFTGLFLFNSGCKKVDLSADETGKKIFVRIDSGRK